MPDKKDKEFVSFAAAHDDWVRKNTPGFFARLRNSRVFPPSRASASGKALGYLWRIALFAAAIFVSAGLVIQWQLSSDAFADSIAGELQGLLNAEEVRLPALKWKNRVGLISDLEARGSDKSFFHTLKADGIRFHLPWLMTFKDRWHLESISMLDFDIDLDADLPPPPEAGEKSNAEAGENEKAGKPGAALPPRQFDPAIAGFGIQPRLDQLQFDVIHADEGTFRWGVAPSSAGSLEKAGLTLTRAGTGFSLIFSSGTLSQNWLEGLAITKLTLRSEPGALLVDECEFRLGASGTGTLSGKIATGETPAIALRAELNSVSLEDILPEKYTDHFAGVVDLSLRFTGSTTTPEGVVCDGTMNVTEALVRKLPAFESMTTIYAEPRFRRLKVNGGAVAFKTHNGHVEISSLELTCGDFARLRANLRLEDPVEQTFSGTLDFGIRPDVVSRYPQITETHFPRVEGDFRWASTPLRGTVGRLTQELSTSMASAMRQIDLKKRTP